MRKKLSLELRRELLTRTAEDYASARKGIKSQIVDQLVAATGYGRKHAITLLNNPPSSCHEKSEMKSKISIWDCRRAIEIAGGLPQPIRGDLFAGPGPDPVARWISETVHVTQLEVKQGRWVIGNIGFTRSGQEHLTKLARDIIADNERL